LIILTHGDFDHCGNAAHLHQAFGCPIAMHADDAGMVEHGDMFVNRKPPNALIRSLLPFFTGFGRAERFTPDVLLKDGADLMGYGLAARILETPGHSKGSISILTVAGELFCGDLLVSTKEPQLNSLIDDMTAATTSLLRLQSLGVTTVYPGHGPPFALQQVRGIDHQVG
jgi:glyoxylase-like metal-dependent hydrolase (beta-lactamase superfamily II)